MGLLPTRPNLLAEPSTDSLFALPTMTAEPSQSPSSAPAPSGVPTTTTSALGDRLRNTLIALAAITFSVLIFFGLRTQTTVPTMASLVKQAIPLETALRNSKPTLVEFYADWCTSCQAMVPTLAAVEKSYGDRLNFVMLNVDNDKWLPEMLAYRVDGIPHFEFLTAEGQAIASAIGEQPETILSANLDALIAGEKLPYARATGKTSEVQPDLKPRATAQDDPRSHGAQVRS